MGRFLRIVAFGAILGALAHLKSWHDAAVLHAITNTTTSAMALALGLLKERCFPDAIFPGNGKPVCRTGEGGW